MAECSSKLLHKSFFFLIVVQISNKRLYISHSSADPHEHNNNNYD